MLFNSKHSLTSRPLCCPVTVAATGYQQQQQHFGNLNTDWEESCQVHIKTGERAFNYEISRGGERGARLKSPHLTWSRLEKASLIYFLQNGQSSIRCCWTSAVGGHGLSAVGALTKYGERKHNLPNLPTALLGTRPSHLLYL